MMARSLFGHAYTSHFRALIAWPTQCDDLMQMETALLPLTQLIFCSRKWGTQTGAPVCRFKIDPSTRISKLCLNYDLFFRILFLFAKFD